jgi:serine/threonine protein kinase
MNFDNNGNKDNIELLPIWFTNFQRLCRKMTISNKYIIHDDQVVGRGAWSVVKRCSPIPPYTPPIANGAELTFVVKVIEKEYLISLTKGDVERAMAEVHRELDVLRHIPAHKNVVTFVEYFETEKQFFLVFEEVHCGDLCEIILKMKDGRLDEDTAKKYTIQIIHAVLHCHINCVVHRDIKPENLLVNNSGEIKLTDFGLAKLARVKEETPTDAVAAAVASYPGAHRLKARRCVCSDVIGTPRYGAPEMFYAKATQTQYDGFRADTWSVGVVAYIILTGSFPFSASATASEKDTYQSILRTQLSIPSHLSPSGADFLQRILQKDPEKRMPLWDALDHPWLEGLSSRRGSSAVSAFMSGGYVSGTVQEDDARKLLRSMDDEAALLHQCIAKLRRELLALQWDDSSRSKRAETPTAARSRLGAMGMSPLSPGARGTSPGRNVSASGSTANSIASRTAARTNSPGRSLTPSLADAASPSKPAPARTASPLARSLPNTLRRGTPNRSGSSSGPAPAGSVVTPLKPLTAPSPQGSSAATGTPKRMLTPGRTTPLRQGAPPQSPPPATGAAKEFQTGETVLYKGYRAMIHFHGTTSFGPGVWLGLEMLEGNEGTNDGTSFVDKKRYFTCAKGKGVFLRTSQVKKLQDP